MNELRDRARRAVLALGSRGRTQRIPDSVREAVLAYAHAERRRGIPWHEIGREVGLSASVLQVWTSGRRSVATDGRLLPVCVTPAKTRAAVGKDDLVLVAPGGYRLEGLTLADAVTALRALR